MRTTSKVVEASGAGVFCRSGARGAVRARSSRRIGECVFVGLSWSRKASREPVQVC